MEAMQKKKRKKRKTPTIEVMQKKKSKKRQTPTIEVIEVMQSKKRHHHGSHAEQEEQEEKDKIGNDAKQQKYIHNRMPLLGFRLLPTVKVMANKKRKTSSPPDFYSSLKLGVLVCSKLASKGSNFIFSPLSIRAALGLLAAARMLEKEDQLGLLSFLGSPTLDDLNTSSASFVEACRPSENRSVMEMCFANGIWVDQSLYKEPSETAKSIFKASVERVDFKTEAGRVRKQINDWIEKGTAGLIKNFLPTSFPDSSTIYVLANALYFKGKWEDKFDTSKTRVEAFHLHDGSSNVKAPFMISGLRKAKYSAYHGFKVLVLPYQQDGNGRHLSLLIFLPNKKDGLIDLLEKVASDPAFIDSHLPKYKTDVDIIKIPKFRISSKFNATKSLREMGLNIPLLETFHGATIEVDEKGTTASATTAHVKLLCYVTGKQPIVFIADHPFMYAIRENVSGAILFYGHVANPSVQ